MFRCEVLHICLVILCRPRDLSTVRAICNDRAITGPTGINNDETFVQQEGPAHSPFNHLTAGIAENIGVPDGLSVHRVEAVQDAGCTQRKDGGARDSWRRARAMPPIAVS